MTATPSPQPSESVIAEPRELDIVEVNADVDPSDRTPDDLSVQRVRPAYEQVAEQLRSRMIAGELQPGQRLPSEGALATMFGIGRSTVREGLRLLTAEQLLTTTRGVKGGTFVVTPDSDNISRYLETSIGLLAGANRLSVDELLEARRCLEVPATRFAIERGDERSLEAVNSTVNGEQGLHMEHSNFHVELLKASGNRMLVVMARPIFDVLRTRLDREAAPSDFWKSVHHDHARIFEAVEARDEEAAVAEMKDHLGHLASVYTTIDLARRQDRVSKPGHRRKPSEQ